MLDDDRQRRALRRYALIDPVVDRTLVRGEKTALLREQAQKHGVSLATLKRYCKQFRLQRLDGLTPSRQRADKDKPRRIPPDVLKLAISLREELPARTTSTIIGMLEDQHPELRGQIKRSTLDRHFRNLGKSRAQLRVVEPKPRRQFAKTARGALWQTDLCILPLYAHDEYGEVKPVVVVALLDDATRFLVHMEAHLSQDAGVVESCFKKAVLKHGLPLGVFFDNGAQFVGEQFTGALAALGVRALRASPGSPESKGKVERFFQTLQTSLLPELKALGGTLSLVDVNRYMAAWSEKYVHTPHRELPKESPTPVERWQADPTPLRPVDPIRLEAAFLLKAQRRVGRTQLVELGGRRYLASEVAPGTQVQVRYHPRQPESVQIWLEDAFVQVAQLYVTPEDAPKVPAAGPIPPGPATGLNFAQMLLEQYQAKLREQYRQAGFARPPEEPTPFTEGAFLTLLGEILGRKLEPLEQDLALQTWHLFGRLDQDRAKVALRRLVHRRGQGLHIAYYLEVVANEHRRETGVRAHV
jgi:putative transposase